MSLEESKLKLYGSRNEVPYFQKFQNWKQPQESEYFYWGDFELVFIPEDGDIRIQAKNPRWPNCKSYMMLHELKAIRDNFENRRRLFNPRGESVNVSFYVGTPLDIDKHIDMIPRNIEFFGVWGSWGNMNQIICHAEKVKWNHPGNRIEIEPLK